MFYKIIFRGVVTLIFAFAGVSLFFHNTTPILLESQPERVGIATLLAASLVGSSIFFFLMSFTDDVKTKIMTSISLIAWLLLNQGAHATNVMWSIEADLTAPIIFNGVLIALAGRVIYQERKTLIAEPQK